MSGGGGVGGGGGGGGGGELLHSLTRIGYYFYQIQSPVYAKKP